MVANKASLIMVEGNQLSEATTVASLVILQSTNRVTQILKILGPKGRVGATKAVAIKIMVMVMVLVMGRPIVRPMLWMPMSSSGIRLISLKEINQGYFVIMFIGLTRLT